MWNNALIQPKIIYDEYQTPEEKMEIVRLREQKHHDEFHENNKYLKECPETKLPLSLRVLTTLERFRLKPKRCNKLCIKFVKLNQHINKYGNSKKKKKTKNSEYVNTDQSDNDNKNLGKNDGNVEGCVSQ